MQAPANNHRGIRLFNTLLLEDNDTATLPKPEHSKRDPQLIDARDNFLLHRAYYKSKIQRKNYPDTFAELIAEVYLSKAQIQKIIQCKGEVLLAVKKQQPSVAELKRQWPHIVW
jgi:hypothetical protein